MAGPWQTHKDTMNVLGIGEEEATVEEGSYVCSNLGNFCLSQIQLGKVQSTFKKQHKCKAYIELVVVSSPRTPTHITLLRQVQHLHMQLLISMSRPADIWNQLFLSNIFAVYTVVVLLTYTRIACYKQGHTVCMLWGCE